MAEEAVRVVLDSGLDRTVVSPEDVGLIGDAPDRLTHAGSDWEFSGIELGWDDGGRTRFIVYRLGSTPAG
jgi:hypothetical protein